MDSGLITEKNHVLDMGCGKGRVSFFLAQTIGCRTTGVDFDSNMIEIAENNRKNVQHPELIQFACAKAEEHEITDEDCFYFFNPFSEKILRSVMGHILDSWYQCPRSIKLFFYYPSHDVLSYLMTLDELIFLDEIDCEDLYEEPDIRERIMVFETVSIN